MEFGAKIYVHDHHLMLFVFIVADFNSKAEKLVFSMFHWWLLALVS